MPDKQYIDDILSGSVPPYYRYANTHWYDNISKQIKHTTISILMISGGLSIILILIADAMTAAVNAYHPIRMLNLFGVALLSSFLFAARIKGQVWYNLLTLSALVLIVIFLPVCIFILPNDPFYILNLLLFPLCVNYILPKKRALLYNHVFLGYATILFLLDFQIRGVAGLFITDPDLTFTLVVLYELIYYSNQFVVQKNINHIRVLIKELVYDSATGLPQIKVLQNCSLLDEKGLFMEISVENYHELRSTFGYENSEEILVQLSRNLLSHEDAFHYTSFKLKGIDFGLVFPGLDGEDREMLLNVLRLIKGKSYLCNGQEVFVRLTAGITSFDSNYVDQTLLEADSSLMEARRKGLEFQIYNHSGDIGKRAEQSLRLYTQLVNNIRNRSLNADLQPIYCTNRKAIVWYEILLRLKDSEGRYCSVAPFLPLAGTSGLDNHFSSFVFSKALGYIQESSLSFSINISVRDALDEHFLNQIRDNALTIRNAPGVIIFEILEIEDVEEGIILFDFINLVHDVGCLVAIDDFGTGYSNYNKILTLNIDILKIDGSLVQNLLVSDKTRYIVKNIVSLCVDADIKIVAEFVNSQSLAKELSEMGIHYLQGYYIGKPQRDFTDNTVLIYSDSS